MAQPACRSSYYKLSLFQIYKILLSHFGKQNWWPIDWEYHREYNTDWRVEVILGAILTQNTRWSNVEKALRELKKNIRLDIWVLANIDEKYLSTLIKPVSFYNIKSSRIKSFFRCILENYENLDKFFRKDVKKLREELLSLEGIGDETADVIILYAAEKPSFVVDSYTKRVFTRLGFLKGNEKYKEIKKLFEKNLPKDVEIYKEYHALIDVLAKTCCTKVPKCKECPLSKIRCKLRN